MGMFTLCESLYLSFRCKHIHHFNTSHSSAHKGTNNSLKSHSASIQPSMDMDTSAKTINTQTDIKVAELDENIFREVYRRHKRWSDLPTAPYTVTKVEAILKKMMSRVHMYEARTVDVGVFQVV